MVLLLKKGNTVTIIRDWVYPLAPETFYHRNGLLNIETYTLESVRKNGMYCYYTYDMETKD